MKKISLLAISIITCFFASAQFASAPATNSSKTTPAGAKAEPTINGKPYSQYKAEVQAKEQAAKNNVAQQPQVPEQFRLDPDKKWSSPAPAAAPKVETQKTVAVVASPAVKPVQTNAAPTAPATLVTPPVVNIAADTQQAVPAESPARIGRAEDLKAQPVQTEKPKGQQ